MILQAIIAQGDNLTKPVFLNWLQGILKFGLVSQITFTRNELKDIS